MRPHEVAKTKMTEKDRKSLEDDRRNAALKKAEKPRTMAVATGSKVDARLGQRGLSPDLHTLRESQKRCGGCKHGSSLHGSLEREGLKS